MPRINENDIKTNYVEGEILSNTEVNAHNTLFLAGINANFDEIEKIKNGETVAITSPDQSLKFVRLNSDKVIEISDDGETWNATASSGHIILDESGNPYQQRGRLQFLNTTITDSGDTTIIQGIQGPQGPKGDKGDNGIQGLQGAQGPMGKTIVPSVNSAGIMSFKVMDTAIAPSDVSVRGPQGPQGPQGIQGPIGPQGLVGPQGVQGPQGPIGPQGLPGTPGTNGNDFIIKDTFNSLGALKLAYPTGYLDSDGNPYGCYVEDEQSIYLWSSTAKDYFNLGSIQGPQGPQGIQGVQGPQGPQGPQGIQGPMGGSNLPVGTITHIDDGVDVPLGWEIIDAEDSYYTANEIDEKLADITDGTTQVGDSAKLGGKSAESYYNLGVPTQTIPSGADLNDYTTGGTYRINHGYDIANLPPTVATSSSKKLVVENIDGDRYMQTLTWLQADHPMWVRNNTGGVWKDWQRIMYASQVSNPNLLINGDFRVNQRNGYYAPVGTTDYAEPSCTNAGTLDKAYNVYPFDDTVSYYTSNNIRYYVKTSDCLKGYVGAGYTVDMWKTTSSSITTTINDDGTVTISANGAVGYYSQAFENTTLESLRGKTVILTVEDGNGKMHSKTGVIPTTTDQQWYVACSYYFGAADNVVVQLYNNSLLSVTFTVSNGSSLTLKSVKLELGNVATPFTPRPYGEELALCQRYLFLAQGTSANVVVGLPTLVTTDKIYFFVPTPVSMRTNPSIIGEINSSRFFIENQNESLQTGFTISVFGFSENGLILTAVKTSHGLTSSSAMLCIRSNAGFSAEL